MFYTIENDEILAVISDHGATLERLLDKATGTEHIWKYDAAYWPRRTSICFPIMSILHDDETEIEGRMYRMENHGFIRETDMTLVKQEKDCLVLRAQSNAYTHTMYPYAFCFDAVYRADGRTLVIEYQISNRDMRQMVYCVGAHTTYKVPIVDTDEMLKDIVIRFPEKETASAHVVENGFVTHDFKPVLLDQDELRLEGLFDNGALMFDTRDLKSRHVTIASLKNEHSTTVDFTDFSQVCLWTKPGTMPFLCVEPTNGLADYVDQPKRLSAKPDVVRLAAGETKVHTQKITIC